MSSGSPRLDRQQYLPPDDPILPVQSGSSPTPGSKASAARTPTVAPASVPSSSSSPPTPLPPVLRTRWVWDALPKRSDAQTAASAPTPLSSDGVWRKVVAVPERLEGLAPTPQLSHRTQRKAAGTPESVSELVPAPSLSGGIQERESKASSRKDRRVLELAPNGNDHAILLIGLGFVVVVLLFAIFRVVVASCY